MIKNIAEFFRYFAAGLLNSLVGYGVFLMMLNILHLDPWYSNAASYVIGLIVAYLLNLFFVFRGSSHSKSSLRRFLFGFAIAYGVNIVILNIMLNTIQFQPELAQLFAMASYTITFYFINKYFVWSF